MAHDRVITVKEAGFDIIGDVHGCAHTLEKLLLKLGYQSVENSYRHPERQVVFVGDIIDRGPRIREVLHIVKNMVDVGAAYCVMGNHEINALGYTTRINPDSEDAKYVRAHNERNNRLIADTLAQFASYPEEWRVFLQWMQKLPLFLEFDGFRVVHACWDPTYVEGMRERGCDNHVSREFIRQSADSDSFEFRCLGRLTRGTDLKIPDGRAIESGDGFIRHFFRTKFWAHAPRFYSDVIFQPDPLPEDLHNRELSELERKNVLAYGEQEKPVFVGHYWLQGKPKVLRPNVACLDYSAVKYGRLVAYRYDGERELSDEKFVWVDVTQENNPSNSDE